MGMPEVQQVLRKIQTISNAALYHGAVSECTGIQSNACMP